MKKSSLTRRSFIKKTSAGSAGAALAAGTSSLYGSVVTKTSKLALLAGFPVDIEKVMAQALEKL